jgi:peptidoglycan/LPS O-acetylase OafA/YrhL
MVIFSHLDVQVFFVAYGYLPQSTLAMLDGNAGVQVFFVLSGFLITLLLTREQQRNNSISLRNFYMRRTLRIVPLYTLFLILITVMHMTGEYVTTWTSLSFAYLYIYNFIPSESYTQVLGHIWSLAVEEHFYLVWPLILSATLLTRRRLLIVGVIVFIVTSLILLHLLTGIEWLSQNFFVYRWSFIAGSNIALGCLSALLLCESKRAGYWKKLFGHPMAPVIALALYANSMYLGAEFVQLGIYLRGVGLMLMIAWVFVNQRNILVRALNIPPLRYLGLISYGLYIYQGFFLSTGVYRHPGQTWPPDPVQGFILLVIVAPLSFHFFEKPFLRLKSRYP